MLNRRQNEESFHACQRYGLRAQRRTENPSFQHIRETLCLSGTHVGYDTSQSRTCTIIVNGEAVKNCILMAVQCEGAKITTIEGLAAKGKLHSIQEAVVNSMGFSVDSVLQA